MKSSLLLLFSVAFGSLAITGCNPMKGSKSAQAAAANFHSLYDAGDFETIYRSAHPDFQSAQPKEQAIGYLRSNRQRLGKLKKATRTGLNVTSVNGKRNVVLNFNSEFENGRANETFTYRINRSDAQLVGWSVDSNILAQPGQSPAADLFKDIDGLKTEPTPQGNGSKRTGSEIFEGIPGIEVEGGKPKAKPKKPTGTEIFEGIPGVEVEK